MSNTSYKSCKCGSEYTKDEWGKLALLPKNGGRMRYSDGILYEFRLCDSCHTTLARQVPSQVSSQQSLPAARPRLPTPAQPMELQSAMLRVSGDRK